MKNAAIASLLLALMAGLAADETPPAAASAAPVPANPVPAAPAGKKPDASKPSDPVPAAATKPATVSPELSLKLNSVMPSYAPPPPEKPKPVTVDPDVLELPKMIVRKPRPRVKLTDEIVMSRDAFNEKLAKENLGSFDRNFLNKFTLPFFGVSAQERARDEYERKKREELAEEVSRLAKVGAVVDPDGAKALKDAASKP
ncbi:MAG TPA: hypothetical protein VL200_10545 [Lacunisphaera sp.]|jgi:hypothetical protein|nr:hypothetical protein [Lacunisphaera sp.]